jgi:hypothetical protein
MAAQERQLHKFQLLRTTIDETIDISWVEFADALKYLMRFTDKQKGKPKRTDHCINQNRQKAKDWKWNDQWQDDMR